MAASMEGVLLTDPKIRVRITTVPATRGAIRVRVYTCEGREILNLRATETEVTVIEVPAPPGTNPPLEKHPGSLWFYGPRGEAIGFLPDGALPALARPLAVEQPPSGPTTPRTLEGLLEALAAVLGGLENLAMYLENRSRRAGDPWTAERAKCAIETLTRWVKASPAGVPATRALIAGTVFNLLERLLELARSSIGTEDSRNAALRFEPVVELARAVRDREAERARRSV